MFDDVALLRQRYPHAETDIKMLGKMYGESGLSIIDNTKINNMADAIVEGMSKNNVFIYEMNLNNGYGHATAISKIKIFDNGKIIIKLMNPSTTGGVVKRNFTDLIHLFKVVKL